MPQEQTRQTQQATTEQNREQLKEQLLEIVNEVDDEELKLFLSATTGVVCTNEGFDRVHQFFAEELLEREVYTHELVEPETNAELKSKGTSGLLNHIAENGLSEKGVALLETAYSMAAVSNSSCSSRENTTGEDDELLKKLTRLVEKVDDDVLKDYLTAATGVTCHESQSFQRFHEFVSTKIVNRSVRTGEFATDAFLQEAKAMGTAELGKYLNANGATEDEKELIETAVAISYGK